MGIVMIAGFGVAWHSLELENYFLGTQRTASNVRSEGQSRKVGPPLHHFVLRVTEPLRWGELAESPGLGLEPELVVESYKCTTRSVSPIVLDAIQDQTIASGQQVTIVLSRGACPKTTPSN